MTQPSVLSALHTRPSLLFRLKDWRDDTSWNEFYRMYHTMVYNVTRRSGLSHADADEVTQDVFKRVAETIHEFESNPDRGSFRGWLLNLTRWRITDKFRARKPHERQMPFVADGDSATDPVAQLPDQADLDAIWESEWQSHVLEAALARLSRRVPARHFQIFELHTRQNWQVLRLARELGVNPASVYLITHRLTKQLRAEVAALGGQFDRH